MEKPKHKDNCLAWGLSLFIDIKSANDVLKSLSKKKNQKVNYMAVACGKLTDNDGIKHSSQNKNHYTFYPKVDFDFNDKFTIVEDNGK